MSQLTKELFLSGARFRFGKHERVYWYEPTRQKMLSYEGVICQKLTYCNEAIEAMVTTVGEDAFSAYATVCGELITVVCPYANYNIVEVEEKEVANV